MRTQALVVAAAIALGLLTLLVPSAGARLVLLTVIGLGLVVVVLIRG